MKTDIIFKRAFNDVLDMVELLVAGDTLPTQYRIGKELGVSRTTVRKVISALSDRGVVRTDCNLAIVTGKKTKRFPTAETISTSEQVERQFLEWILREDTLPGTTVNELVLARRFSVATTSIREFLNRFMRFGLIEKRPNSGWVLVGFTEEYAIELHEVREMFEVRSALAFGNLPKNSDIWSKLELLRREHISLLENFENRFHDFSELDARFHQLVNSASPNRFIDSFNDVITLIFHYHYQWNKADERERNEIAIMEHLDYIGSLQSRDLAKINKAVRTHLASARNTLLRSIRN